MPYYKWAFRALGELELLSELRDPLGSILTDPKEETIEAVSAAVIAELRRQGLTAGTWDYLEPHAYEITKHIRSAEIAALHVMEG
jgi:hypothetical protein